MASIDEHERRIRKLEGWKVTAEGQLKTMSTKLDANTTLTEKVKTDTGAIVAWTEAAKLGGSAVKWLAIVGSALGTAWLAFLTILHFKP